MSICMEESLTFRTREQPIYIGNEKIETVFVGEECVYPDAWYQGYTAWVPLDDEVCTTYDNKLIDRAGILLYTTGPAEITKCCVLMLPDYAVKEKQDGEEMVCDAFEVGVRCRYPNLVRVAPFGTYKGRVIYDYNSLYVARPLRGRELKTFYNSGPILYTIMTSEGRGVRIAGGTAVSETMGIAYTEEDFVQYMNAE